MKSIKHALAILAVAFATVTLFAQNTKLPKVNVQFGNSGPVYTLTLENNSTAIQLARSITDAGRNLPIYDFDNYTNWEYFQFYDIPSRYKFDDNAKPVTSQKAGEVYYSAPNRIMLFYRDAQIKGNFTKVGTFDLKGNTAAFTKAVAENPVLDYWGNKLILIRYAK